MAELIRWGILGAANFAREHMAPAIHQAKGAVLALTNTLALEGAAHGVFSNSVLPWGATRLARPGSGAPDAALGEDLLDHQPDGPEGRRWRALLNEMQIVLHNHPWNAQRVERGLVPINALWIWGGGVLPDRVAADAGLACSDDDLVRAAMQLAGGKATRLPSGFAGTEAGAIVLHDLRGSRDLAAMQRNWLIPAADAVLSGALDTLVLDTADGSRLRIAKAQRWRFWRRVWSMPLPRNPANEKT